MVHVSTILGSNRFETWPCCEKITRARTHGELFQICSANPDTDLSIAATLMVRRTITQGILMTNISGDLLANASNLVQRIGKIGCATGFFCELREHLFVFFPQEITLLLGAAMKSVIVALGITEQSRI